MMSPATLATDALTLDYTNRDAVIGSRKAGLTSREFDLLACLAGQNGKVLSRRSLFEAVWGYRMEYGSNSLDVYIYRVRKKIEVDPASPQYLLTQRGAGYKLANVSDA